MSEDFAPGEPYEFGNGFVRNCFEDDQCSWCAFGNCCPLWDLYLAEARGDFLRSVWPKHYGEQGLTITCKARKAA